MYLFRGVVSVLCTDYSACTVINTIISLSLSLSETELNSSIPVNACQLFSKQTKMRQLHDVLNLQLPHF